MTDSQSQPFDGPRGYEVYASNDPTDFGQPIATGTGDALTVIELDTTTAQHIRIVQTGDDVFRWWSIYELDISASSALRGGGALRRPGAPPSATRLGYVGAMCVNCMSNAEAAGAAVVAATYFLKPPIHKMLAKADLAPDPDPVAHDVRTVAFLEALDLDPVDALGLEAVEGAARWTPSTTWVPFRDRLRRPALTRPALA